MAIKQNPRIAQAARAAISLAVGLFLTFSQSHGAEIGLIALGVFGLGFAILNGFASVIFQKGLSAIENVPLTMVALLIGIFALMAPNSVSGAIETSVSSATSDALAFKFLVTGWAIIAGAFELYQSRRAGFRSANGRDLLINASMGLLLAALFLLAPLDIVSQVGFFGAYLLMSGVHGAIAAASPTTNPAASPAANATPAKSTKA
jgi:uncharacterized membrane protein HdeD (DUF308 family)